MRLTAVAVASGALLLSGCSASLQENHKDNKAPSHQSGGQQGKGLLVINVGSADKPHQPVQPITVPKIAVQQTQDAKPEAGMRDETPDNVPPKQIEAGREQQDHLAIKDLLPIGLPLAAPVERGCRSEFVRNSSSRRGVAPREVVIHWTGSKNVPGWSDVQGVVAWFNNVQSQASSNYVIDAEGHCAYIVREYDKAWAQAAFNPLALSIEVVNSGGPFENFGGYLVPKPGLRKIGQVVADMARRWHIPLRVGATYNCRVLRGGIVDHKSLGICGGGHPDIGKYSLAPIIHAARHARTLYNHHRCVVAHRHHRRCHRRRA
jgi:hypothetical protein